MYFNKFLFPAPNTKYKVEDLESYLIYIPRERFSKKRFKLSKKRSFSENKNEQKQKKSSVISRLFSRIGFKGSKSKDPKKCISQNEQIPIEGNVYIKIEGNQLKDQKLYTSSNQAIDPNYKSHLEKQQQSDDIISGSQPEKRCHEYQNEIIEYNSHINNGNDELTTQNKKQVQNIGITTLEQEKAIRSVNVDIIENGTNSESKRNKKKNACFGFAFKQKDKKFNLELFDEFKESDRHQVNNPKDLKHLNVGIIDQILSSNKKSEDLQDKDSSEDSEDEEHEHTHHTIMNGNKVILKNVIFIPCALIESPKKTRKTILYFHANGEDLNQVMEFAMTLNKNLLVNIIAVEYPGYGIYKGSASERKVCLDAETVYNCLTRNVGITERDIFIFGRSIGTGPAIWLSSIKNPGCLILMSSFSSIKHVAKHLVGKVGGYFIKQRFRNYKLIQDVNCPIFGVHGKKDNLIPYKQSVELFDKMKIKEKELYLSEEMTHSDYDYFSDIGGPLLNFIKKYSLLQENENVQRPDFSFLKTPNYEPLLEKYKSIHSDQNQPIFKQ